MQPSSTSASLDWCTFGPPCLFRCGICVSSAALWLALATAPFTCSALKSPSAQQPLELIRVADVRLSNTSCKNKRPPATISQRRVEVLRCLLGKMQLARIARDGKQEGILHMHQGRNVGEPVSHAFRKFLDLKSSNTHRCHVTRALTG